MSESVDVAEAKSKFSELLNRAAYGKERFLIRKRGRPVGAIVSVADLERLETAAEAESGGLLAAAGTLADFDDWADIMDEVVRDRQDCGDRSVTFE
jgi:prevent-host-death family protein